MSTYYLGLARHYFEAAGQTSKRFGQNSTKLNSRATTGPSSWSWPGLVEFAARRACSNLGFYLAWKSRSTASSIEDEIRTTINNFEPRVNLLNVKVAPDYDNGEFNVTVRYEIVGIDVAAQQLSFALQPTR